MYSNAAAAGLRWSVDWSGQWGIVSAEGLEPRFFAGFLLELINGNFCRH
jgi:hypothetical protein